MGAPRGEVSLQRPDLLRSVALRCLSAPEGRPEQPRREHPARSMASWLLTACPPPELRRRLLAVQPPLAAVSAAVPVALGRRASEEFVLRGIRDDGSSSLWVPTIAARKAGS
jgi:hypothetical protein